MIIAVLVKITHKKLGGKQMNSKSVAKFSIAIVVILAIAYIAAFGININGYQIPSALDEENGIRRGLDLAGGSYVVFEADTEEAVSEEDLTAVVAVLRNRLDSQGFTEATVTTQGDRRVRVEIPAVDDPDAAVEILGATAKLEFIDKDGNVVLTGGEDVKNATAAYEAMDATGKKGNIVKLTLTNEGSKKFAEATGKIANYADGENFIAISLDGNVISSPRVSEQINSTECIITGDFDSESAKTLAGQIKSGQLPFSLKVAEMRSIGAQLGEGALDKSLLAGCIGLIIVMLFMIILYRMCGLVASIALVAYVAIVALILSAFRINLTLPGIGGIILTIGTAVDANVIIFERIKEELKVGKTLRASVDAGFNRAFTAILDSNVTTMIAAVVLYLFGTGTIKGFAITLGIGTLVSMFTAIFVTRFLLRQMIGFNIKNPKLYSA